MIRAEGIDRANQAHRPVQRRRLACQRPPAPYQGRDASAEGGVQPFHVRNIDRAASLRSLQQSLRLRGGALHQATLDIDYLFARTLLDRLGQEDSIPGSKTRSTRSTHLNRFPKDSADGLDGGSIGLPLRLIWSSDPACQWTPLCHLAP